jgi:hypothetical protein
MARSVCHLCEKEILEKPSGARKSLRKLNRQYSSNGLRRRQPTTDTELEAELEVSNEALLQGERVLNEQKEEHSARAKGWYTQKGCICKTEPKKMYRCFRNSCYWCEVDDNIECKKGNPWRSWWWWWPHYSYDYLDRSMYPILDEEELEKAIERQQRLGDILSSPSQGYELTAEEELELLEASDMYSDKDD